MNKLIEILQRIHKSIYAPITTETETSFSRLFYVMLCVVMLFSIILLSNKGIVIVLLTLVSYIVFGLLISHFIEYEFKPYPNKAVKDLSLMQKVLVVMSFFMIILLIFVFLVSTLKNYGVIFPVFIEEIFGVLYFILGLLPILLSVFIIIYGFGKLKDKISQRKQSHK